MSDLIGREVGPYRILEQIGLGGMATVYKAYHATMDRYVAIKILPEQTSQDPDLRERFQREARVIARLEHVHILPVHEYGQFGNRLYLVMRYVEAGTLKDRLAYGPLPIADVSHVLHQIGSALAHAHRMGIVHRDVKPSNVLLDTLGNCYLTDFGLAKIMESSVQITGSGVGVGTPAYMSPEQGQGQGVDIRSDIYSLGVVLYELVTGQVPFKADTPLAVVLQHVNAPLPLPSTIKSDIPPALEQVILKALAKNPEFRFQTVDDMLKAFDSAVGLPGTLVTPSPGGAPHPISQPSPTVSPRKNILLWLLAGMGLVAAGAAIVLAAVLVFPNRWSRWQAAQATTISPVTEVASARASRDASGSDMPTVTSTVSAGPAPGSTPTHTLPPAPGPTHTATATTLPTSTSTRTPTRTATATRQPTPTPTRTLAPTSTPLPTHTPSSTPTRLATRTPTPTARWLAAPTLIAPPSGASFQGWNARVVLQWSSVPGLAMGEYYVVRIPYDSTGGVAEFWRTEPSLRLPAHLSLKDVGFPDRHYTWSVQVMRCTANCDRALDDQARKEGVAVGAASAQGDFYWHPDISGAVPTPTRAP